MSASSQMGGVTCYCIPGLGASGEIFDNLVVPPLVEKRIITWISPHRGETIAQYATRLINQIDQSKPFVLIGCSFGGVIASELARLTNPILTVLISSFTSRHQMPGYYRSLAVCGAHKLVPFFSRPELQTVLGYAFSASDPDAKTMLSRQLKDCDPVFLRWALAALLDWNPVELPPKILHIHGEKDRVLPLRYLKPDVVIPGGGHLIVYTHGEEIGRIIADAVR